MFRPFAYQKPVTGLIFSFNRFSRCWLHLGEHFTRGSLNEIKLESPVPLAGRKYLPSSNTPNFPKFLSDPRENFPLLVKAKDGGNATVKHWAKRCREVIEEAYRKFEEDGTAMAILFRGLPVRDEKEFGEWGSNLGYKPHAYVGGTAPRYEIVDNVSGGSLESKEFTIEPHNEMAYSVAYPKIFTMSCFKKATRGGETAISDVRDLLPKIDSRFVAKCEQKKVCYWHYLSDEKSDENCFQSWQMMFMTKDRDEVEEVLKKNKYSYKWDGSSLFYWNDLSPFIVHPRNGERLWFSQPSTSHYSFLASNPYFEGWQLDDKRRYPFHTSYGDGEEIEQHFIDEYRRINWENAVGFKWQNGDVLFLDQLVVQHSRLAYEGERKVGISLFTY